MNLPTPKTATPGFLLVAWGNRCSLIPLSACMAMHEQFAENGKPYWRIKANVGGSVTECYASPTALAAAFGEWSQ